MSQISPQYCDGLEQRIKELSAENATLREQLAASERTREGLVRFYAGAVLDANRYRFAKSRAYVGVNTHAKTCLWVLRGIFEVPGEDFDAAIDAAIEKEKAE